VLAPVTNAVTDLAGDVVGTASATLDHATSSIPAATSNEEQPETESASTIASAQVVTDAPSNEASVISAVGALGSSGIITFDNGPDLEPPKTKL
jgi:hypothetical protein